MSEALPLLYGELAPWFHLLTAPEDYAEEEAFFSAILYELSAEPPRTLLELGSGGGNNASHYKRRFTATLSDMSEEMLAQSRRINPECEHVLGDMRTLRLGRQFDAVFVHDAVSYLTAENDVRQAIETAFVHLRPGGVALFVPDCVRETFAPATDCGGHDGDGRALRYLSWTYDPDPSDTVYTVDYAYLLHEGGQPVRCLYDQHLEGVFPRTTWLRLLAETGFRAEVRPLVHSEVPPGAQELFVCTRPAL